MIIVDDFPSMISSRSASRRRRSGLGRDGNNSRTIAVRSCDLASLLVLRTIDEIY